MQDVHQALDRTFVNTFLRKVAGGERVYYIGGVRDSYFWLLRTQFGGEYDAYRSRTWRLLPGLY